MNLNISYGSTSGAPAAFFSAVNYVVGLFDAIFTNNATVNIEIGYGTFPSDGSTVPPLAESQQANLVFGNYTQVRQALLNESAPGATTLPAASPLSGGLVLGSAQERALGLIGASSALDGWVGVASDVTLQQIGGSWSYSATATPGSNQYYRGHGPDVLPPGTERIWRHGSLPVQGVGRAPDRHRRSRLFLDE